MKYFDWSEEKNELIKQERGITFEEIIFAISNGGLVDVINHPNEQKYPGQKIFFVEINDYIFTVPFIEDSNRIFLKTVYPDRIATKKYLGDKI
jgi:hypothetical protein